MQSKYLVQRRRTLAYGAPSAPVDLLGAFSGERFSAESEDFCALADAFNVYTEQERRDYDKMRRLYTSMAGRCAATRVEADEEDESL